jgi:hypothetical protein
MNLTDLNLKEHRRIQRQKRASVINLIGSVLILVAIIAAAIGSARADTLDIGIGIPNATSHAEGKCNNCNENNSLFMATYTHSSGWGLTGARFINSHWTPTTAVAVSYTWRLELQGFDALELRPVVGLMRGYTREQIDVAGVCLSDDVCPMAALSGTFMVTEWAGVTVVQFGADVRTWAFRLRFDLS